MGTSKYGSVTNLIGMACWSFTKDDFKGSAGWTVITRKSCNPNESEGLVPSITVRERVEEKREKRAERGTGKRKEDKNEIEERDEEEKKTLTLT
jgi:hypothetical protein